MKAPSLGLLNTPPRDHTDEWLFLAQHVGLPTRLLDWTEGLFIALYFALLEDEPVIWMLDPIELNRRSCVETINDNVFPLTWFSADSIPVTKHDILELSLYLRDEIKNISNQPNELMDQSENVTNRPPSPINIGNINIRGAWERDRLGTELPVAIHPTNIHIRMNTQKSCFTVHGKQKISLSDLVDSRILKKYVIAKDSVETWRTDLRMIGVTHTSVFPDLDHLARELSEIF
jgi:hypothetical protein